MNFTYTMSLAILTFIPFGIMKIRASFSISRMYSLLLVGLLFHLSSHGIFAQNADTVTWDLKLEEFVITAQYEPTHYKNALHNVEVITQNEIRQRGVTTLDQALSMTASVRLRTDPILGTGISMRGIGASNVAILIDGVPIIGRLDGAIDLSQIGLHLVDRIEIVEGALSNIYGSNAAGGVINIISKKSQTSPTQIQINSQIESIGQQQYDLHIGNKFGNVLAQFNARWFDFSQHPADSMRLLETISFPDGSSTTRAKYPFNPKRQKSVGGLLRYDFSDDHYILARYQWNDELVSDFGPLRRPQFRPYADDQFFVTEREDMTVQYVKKFSTWHLDLTSAYNKFLRIVENKRWVAETDEYDPALASSDTTIFQNYFFRGVASIPVSAKIKVIPGIQWTQEVGSGDRILPPDSSSMDRAKYTEIAAFVETKFSPTKNIDLALSGRWTRHSVYQNQITPSLMLRYQLHDRWWLRASYAQGYRNPSLKELYLEFIDINHYILGNSALRPEISHDYQTTLTYQPHSKYSFSVNLYNTQIEQMIGLVEFEPLRYQYENIDRYQVAGIQPKFDLKMKAFTLSGGLSIGYWSTNISSGNAPTKQRVLDWTTQIGYHLKKIGLDLLLFHRYLGDQSSFFQNGDQIDVRVIDGYHLTDLSVGKSFWSDRINLQLGIRNLFNIQNTNIQGNGTAQVHQSAGQNPVSVGRSAFLQIGINL